MLTEFRESVFKYLVFLQVQFGCEDEDVFKDATYKSEYESKILNFLKSLRKEEIGK